MFSAPVSLFPPVRTCATFKGSVSFFFDDGNGSKSVLDLGWGQIASMNGAKCPHVMQLEKFGEKDLFGSLTMLFKAYFCRYLMQKHTNEMILQFIRVVSKDEFVDGLS